MLLRIVLSTVLVAYACQQPAAATKEEAAPLPAASKPSQPSQPSQPAAAAGFDSAEAVYKRYAETLSAAQWAQAIALFTPAGKVQLVLGNFKGLALLPGSPHPKKLEYKAVMRDFCQAHTLSCTDDSWNETFALTMLSGGDVTPMMNDVTSLAKAHPDATYVEIMKLVQGVDPSQVFALDPTLTEVKYTGNTATGTARRSDGKTTTMSFEKIPERGWMIVE